jgi:hypothetical protein
MRLPLLFLIIQVAACHTASGQTKIASTDSVYIKSQIEGFYSWYIGIVKDSRLDNDFNPTFMRRDDGMTTLNFTKYRNGLRRYKFTEDFIQRKVSEYEACVNNLGKIPFDKFSRFTDLDDFENIHCDFGNRYDWTGGMEPKDKAELISLKPVNSKTITGHVAFTSHNRPDGTAIVTFRKFRKEWRVDNLRLE